MRVAVRVTRSATLRGTLTTQALRISCSTGFLSAAGGMAARIRGRDGVQSNYWGQAVGIEGP